jgi:hypothetical protein
MWVEKSIAQSRYDICKQCDKFVPLTTLCSECLCIMKIKVKVAAVRCPLNKWTYHEEDKS